MNLVKGLGKFMAISMGGLIVLIAIVMAITVANDVTPDEVKSANLIDSWQWYRMVFYALIILMWFPLCRYMTSPLKTEGELSKENFAQIEEVNAKMEKDFVFLKKQWWKLLLALVFFEVVFIRQFGG